MKLLTRANKDPEALVKTSYSLLDQSKQAKPFLKWVGGKTQLLEAILDLVPTKIGTYYEPFLGGGAVFFATASLKRFEQAVINDRNQELVDCYTVIRDFPQELMRRLDELEYSPEVFAELRKLLPLDMSPVYRAARTIYLNKAGFNGLYRVNKSGQFNAPFGRHKKPPRFYDENVILACSLALNGPVRLYSQDFSTIVDQAGPLDFVYLDPPYVPVNPTSNFVSYTAGGFSQADQERVVKLFKDLAGQGVGVLASNSDTDVVRSLYADFDIYEIKARRSINSNGAKRGPVGEVLIAANLPHIRREP